MQWLDWSAFSPAENLAMDEALLLDRERIVNERGERNAPEVLRVWESPVPFVVLGVAGHVASEVHLRACKERGIPVLRRHSGGGTVLQGPGCLNFALVLSLPRRAGLANFSGSFRVILEPLIAGLGLPNVQFAGTSDLALGVRKFSGNAQKRKGSSVLHHGTLLYGMDLAEIGHLLQEPERRPAYRGVRVHADFVANLPLGRDELKQRVRNSWSANDDYPAPLPPLDELVSTKYGTESWSYRF